MSYSITTQTEERYYALVGATFTISIETDDGSASYAWQHSRDGGTTWMGTSWSTTATLSHEMTASLDGRMFRCVVTFSDGTSETSDTATVYVGVEPVAPAPPTYSVKVELGGMMKGTFYPLGDGYVMGPSEVKSVSYSQTIGDDGRLAVGIAEASQCDMSVLSSALPDGWRGYWQRVSVGELDYDEEYEWTVLGSFKPDLSTVKDDRLFTSYTAHDALYYVNADFDCSSYSNYPVGGTSSMYASTVAADLESQLRSCNVALDCDADMEAVIGPSTVLGMFRPKGTLREVLAYFCLMTGCNLVNVGGTHMLRRAGSQQYVGRSKYKADSLETCCGWTSKFMAVVFDVDTTVTVGSSGMEFDMVAPAVVNGSVTVDGGYIVEPDCGGLVWDGMSVKSTATQSKLASLLSGDVNTAASNAAACLSAMSDLTSLDGTTIERSFAADGYDGASVEVGGLVLPGDVMVVEDPLDASTLYCFPAVSSTVTYDGSLSSAVSADGAEYDSDSYLVMAGGTVKRVTSSSTTNKSAVKALGSTVSDLGSTVSGISSTLSKMGKYTMVLSGNVLYISIADEDDDDGDAS